MFKKILSGSKPKYNQINFDQFMLIMDRNYAILNLIKSNLLEYQKKILSANSKN